ncbi:uncharacterized protein [Littorina saxatilis]|uniref:uncharacterized protein n=1 Tax=Littorina saxatilis TaxID=31220 RepID=UPI0038B5B42D
MTRKVAKGWATSTSIYIFEDPKSYRDALTAYKNSTNNKTYYRGRLVISWPFFDVLSNYNNNPNVQLELDNTWYSFNNQNIDGIATPSSLTHNCTDLNHIPGSRAAPCFCSADSLGSPPGRLVWLLGDTVTATGEYNVSHLQLPSDNMGDQCDGLTVTCQLDWVKATTLIVTKHETCGLTHNCSYLNHIPGSRAAPCFCSADSLPLGSPPGRLLWLLGDTVMATGEYNVRHLQLPSDKMGDQCDGLTVTCQRDWVNAATLIVTKHDACNSEENHQIYKWATIVLGPLVFVVGIVFIIVVVILCRRGRPHSGLNTGPVESQPQPKKNSDQLSTFTGQNIYEGLQRNDSGPQTKSEELPTFTGQNIYEGLTPNDPQQNPGAKKHPVKKNAPKREVEGHM